MCRTLFRHVSLRYEYSCWNTQIKLQYIYDINKLPFGNLFKIIIPFLQMDLLSLPPELSEKIASYLSRHDLLNLWVTSSVTRLICQSESIWRSLTHRDYFSNNSHQKTLLPGESWHKCYLRLFALERLCYNISQDLIRELKNDMNPAPFGCIIMRAVTSDMLNLTEIISNSPTNVCMIYNQTDDLFILSKYQRMWELTEEKATQLLCRLLVRKVMLVDWNNVELIKYCDDNDVVILDRD